MITTEQIKSLKELLVDFPENQIGKLPKPTKWQTDEAKRDRLSGKWCQECSGWHHAQAIHLDYVGHAALTKRFLDVDLLWSWEPFAVDANGLPAISNGLLWIKLTICGVTRIGVGGAGGKTGGNAVKEMIGDALRNAGMRFGAALNLWHKGDLFDNDQTTGDDNEQIISELKILVSKCSDVEQLTVLDQRWKKSDKTTVDQKKTGNTLINKKLQELTKEAA